MNEFVLLFIVIVAIYKNSFSGKPLRFTCKNFLLNAYLYIFLSFILVALMVNMYDRYKIPSIFDIYKNKGLVALAVFFISIGLLLAVMSWSSKQLMQKHLLWVLWIALMAYTLYPLFQISSKIYDRAKLITFAIMACLTMFTFMYPGMVSLSWGTSLMVFLFGLIITHLVGLVYPYTSRTHYFLSYFSILLFSFFMLYDTKVLMAKAKKCVQADYINDSLGVFLDGMNIFTSVFSLQGNQ